LQAIVVAVIVHDGRALLARRRRSEGNLSWQFPAGEQEPGETPEQTAVREVAEEVGLVVRPVAILGGRDHPHTQRHLVYVACEVATGTATVVDAEELAEVAWCDQTSLDERIPAGVYAPVRDHLRERLTDGPRPAS
jgi:8-oxo-dGTP diphosphatase